MGNELSPGQEVTLVAVGGHNNLPLSLADTKAEFIRMKRTGMVLVKSRITGKELTIHPFEIRELNPHFKG